LRSLRILLIVGGLLLVVLLSRLPIWWTEWLWFDQLGYASVWVVQWWTKGLLVLAFAGIFGLILGLNLGVAGRVAPDLRPEGGAWVGGPARFRPRWDRWLPWLVLLVSLGFAWGMRQYWDEWLRFRHGVSFSPTDPNFGQDPILGYDIGFYLFRFPFWKILFRSLFGAVLLALLATAGLYALRLEIRSWEDLSRVRPAVYAHLSLLGACLWLLKAGGYWLNRFDLLCHEAGPAVVYGAGFTDVHVRLPMLSLLVVLAAASGGFLLVNVWRRSLKLFIGAMAAPVLGSLLGGGVYPALYQRLIVQPNELDREAPYLRYNIGFTRRAYGLDRIRERNFEVRENLTWAALKKNAATVENIRLWDERPLKQTYEQIQEIRTYYDFRSIDLDRYVINGRLTQVALSPRELDVDRLPAAAQTWVNRTLVFTHGYGLCMSPVNSFIGEGLPEFLVADIPPRTRVPELRITEPRIYYGEVDRPDHYVVVKIREQGETREFDYPVGESQNRYTSYQGRGGVPLGSFWRRLAFTLRFRHLNLLISDAITPQSRIQFFRSVRERVQRLAPFLYLDFDPYLVVAEGRLFWILDAYTTAREYPYSEPFQFESGLRSRSLNYLRNSVKVVVDAYHGDVTFYIFDAQDPVLQTYQRIFPSLFHPRSEMPPALQAHVRYPQELFLIQARMFRTYHMTEPDVFYNREDAWDPAYEKFTYLQGGKGEDQRQEMLPYYAIMKLPGAAREQFLLMVPYTPRGSEGSERHNMIAWLCAECDGNFDLTVFKFPKRENIYGPMQVESRIDQDPTISPQLTLWGRGGSTVIRGNLLVIPIEQSLLYVEPLYISAEEQPLPELKRIIVAYGNRVVMQPTLSLCLEALFNPHFVAPEGGEGLPAEALREKIQRAWEHYQEAQEALRRGDYRAYGQALERLERILREAAETELPAPAKGATGGT